MVDIGTLIEGVGLSGVGAFMVFAPEAAENVSRAVPFVGLGGPLRSFFGYLAILAGGSLIAVWLIENLWLLHSN